MNIVYVLGTENDCANFDNIIFTWKTLPSKGFERSVYWNEYKTKRENEKKANNCKYFSNQTLYELTDCFGLFKLKL